MMADRIGFWNGSRAAWAGRGCVEDRKRCHICGGADRASEYRSAWHPDDALPSLDMAEIDLTTDPLDIHSAWDAEQQRIETAFKVPVYDEETAERLRAAQELADSINADTTTPAVASVVDGAVRQDVPDPIEVRLVPDDDGLPPLAEGSRWDGTGVVDSTSTRTLVWIAEAHDQSGVWFTTEIESREHGAWLANVRNVIARHERANGCYWADEVRKLVSELHMRSMSGTFTEDPQKARHDAYADAAESLESILARLRAKGVC